MAKRRWQFGIKALMVVGVAALLLWVGGSMGGPLLASARNTGGQKAHGRMGGAAPAKSIKDAAAESVDDTTAMSADQIESGYDSWVTPDSGKTKLDLTFQPGFFCNGLSGPITKTIKFKECRSKPIRPAKSARPTP